MRRWLQSLLWVTALLLLARLYWQAGFKLPQFSSCRYLNQQSGGKTILLLSEVKMLGPLIAQELAKLNPQHASALIECPPTGPWQKYATANKAFVLGGSSASKALAEAQKFTFMDIPQLVQQQSQEQGGVLLQEWLPHLPATMRGNLTAPLLSVSDDDYKMVWSTDHAKGIQPLEKITEQGSNFLFLATLPLRDLGPAGSAIELHYSFVNTHQQQTVERKQIITVSYSGRVVLLPQNFGENPTSTYQLVAELIAPWLL